MGKDGSGRQKKREVATFACGCFWSKEYYFSRAPGVIGTRVGYTGGHQEDPTYREVCRKNTGHAEAVEVTYDPEITSFADLTRLFFQMHEPTIDRTANGGQYRSVIFYHNGSQRTTANELLGRLRKNGYDAATQLEPARGFWPAEARHQKYCDSRGIEPGEMQNARYEI